MKSIRIGNLVVNLDQVFKVKIRPGKVILYQGAGAKFVIKKGRDLTESKFDSLIATLKTEMQWTDI